MKFDWITWGIWFIGLVILITWIYVPIQEFRRMYREHKQKNQEQNLEQEKS